MTAQATCTAPMTGGGMVAHGVNCCGKPHGCTREDPSCAFLEHPYKRWARGELSLDELNVVSPPKAIERARDDEDRGQG